VLLLLPIVPVSRPKQALRLRGTEVSVFQKTEYLKLTQNYIKLISGTEKAVCQRVGNMKKILSYARMSLEKVYWEMW